MSGGGLYAGLGAALCRRFAAEGHHVLVASRTAEQIEEPVHPDDLEGYGRISRMITQRIAAGEEDCTLRGFQRLIDEGGAGLARIDLTRCGLTQSMKIADYAFRR